MPVKKFKKNGPLKVLLVYVAEASFIENDMNILSKYYELKTLKYFGKRGVIEIFKSMVRNDVVIAWFEADHSFFAVLFSKILRKKSIVSVAESYSFSNQWKKMTPSIKARLYAQLSVMFADIVLADSQVKDSDIRSFLDNDRVKLLLLGFDEEKFKPGNEKENMVITIGIVNEDGFKRKGHKRFVEAAKYFPDTRFILIGKHTDSAIDKLRKMASDNVEFTGWIEDDELIRYMQRAKVYVQASEMESFGCSVAEAMLCECVPVVSRNGALPEVVGDTGFYVHLDKSETIAKAIKEALTSDLGKKARERIKTRFTLKKREDELKKIIDNLT